MAFTTSGQETECALFLQPRSPQGTQLRSKRYGINIRSHNNNKITEIIVISVAIYEIGLLSLYYFVRFCEFYDL